MKSRTDWKLRELVIWPIALIVVFSTGLVNALNPTKTSTILFFQEVEPGVESYTTRFIVNSNFLRIDAGVDGGDFTLYDKQKNVIYNVTHKSELVLELVERKTSLSPDLQARISALKLGERELSNTEMPRIDGKQTKRHFLLAEEKVCAEVNAVEGLLTDTMDTFIQYQLLLTNNNRNNIKNMPVEYISNCMLANDIKGASRYLDFGFPIYWLKENGFNRFLSNYKIDQSVPASLFEIPEKYDRYAPGSIR